MPTRCSKHHSVRQGATRLAALLLALAAAAGCSDAAAPGPSRTGLVVSDLHFDPLSDPALAAQLVAAPVSQWDAIAASSNQLAYSPTHRDTNFLLLHSALAEMRAQAPRADVVFIGGDLLVHEFNLVFANRMPGSSAADYAAFAAKTEQYVAQAMAQAFPEAQLIPTLGDWDTDGATSGLPSAAFLTSYASTWSGTIARRGAAAPQPTFGSGGYYSTGFPIDPRGRLISLYTQPWAAECTTGCGTAAGSPGATELAWLEAQLGEARAQGQRVWLLGHIPPGLSAPGTASNLAAGNTCAGSLAPFYADGYATQLQALYRQNGDLIRFGFFAHQHLDDFRLVRDAAGGPLFGVKLLPSITPMLANSPAFILFSYDPEAGAITEATTYTITNLATASTTTPGTWAPEYRFTRAYGQAAFDAAGVAGAVAAIQSGGAARTAYTTYFPSSNPAGNPAGDFSPFTSYGCAFDRLTVADFSACFCPL
jgi:hypothetical protein